jgi:hypothetical protein
MSSRQLTSIKRKAVRLGVIALCTFLAICSPLYTPPAQAETPTYGYLWELVFDFEDDFNGVLKIEVGPWQGGNLAWIEAISETTVECEPSGRISLTNGFANFGGSGSLECEMDIAQIVLDKHNLIAQKFDTYGSFIMQTTADLMTTNPAPIFTHPDARLRLEPIGAVDVRVISDLSNEHGPIQSLFSGIMADEVYTYTSDYVCDPELQCDMIHSAGTTEITLNEQGEPVTFTTGPTTFTIGKDGTQFLFGQVDSIIIDPGNFAHQAPGFTLFMPLAVSDPF